MNSFYKSIGLYDHLSVTLEMNGAEFTESLKKITYKTNTSFFSLVPDNGIPTRFEYRGMVYENDFTIKRRLRFFDLNVMHCVIKGSVIEENNRTRVAVEFLPFVAHFLALIFGILISMCVIFQIVLEINSYLIVALPFILAFVNYFALKRCLKRDKYDFEREMIFIDRKNNQFKNII